jgi:hypothetical protein
VLRAVGKARVHWEAEVESVAAPGAMGDRPLARTILYVKPNMWSSSSGSGECSLPVPPSTLGRVRIVKRRTKPSFVPISRGVDRVRGMREAAVPGPGEGAAAHGCVRLRPSCTMGLPPLVYPIFSLSLRFSIVTKGLGQWARGGADAAPSLSHEAYISTLAIGRWYTQLSTQPTT